MTTPTTNRSVMLILDGMQDHAYAELGGKTPLEAGEGEGFALLDAQSDRCRVLTTPPGKEADTLHCMLNLLGVPAEALPTGRMYYEALAEGMNPGRDDLVLRFNFVEIAPDGALFEPCRTPPEAVASALMRAMEEEFGVTPQRVGGYKCLQVLPGARAMHAGIECLPPHNHQGRPLEAVLPRGNPLGERLAGLSRNMLELHRPYTVLHWSPSVAEDLPSLRELRGLKGAAVSATAVLVGAFRAMGMEVPKIEGGTGETDTNLNAKLCATLELLERNDLVVVHIGGTDEATHRRNPVEKAEFIARIDQELLRPLLEQLPGDAALLLLSDHEALCTTAGHTTEPVTAWRSPGSGKRSDRVVDGPDAVDLLRGNLIVE